MSDFFGQNPAIGQALQGSSPSFSGSAPAIEAALAATSFKGIEVEPWEMEAINRSVAAAEDQEAESWRWANAYQFARLYDKPLADTYQNLEAYNLDFLGKAEAPKTAVKAIADSLELGRLTLQTNDLWTAYMMTGGTDEGILSQIEALESQTQALGDNVPNRGIVTEALKAGAQSAPFMVRSYGVGALAVGAGALVTGGLSTMGVGALFKLGSGAASAQSVVGLEYGRMRKNGVDHDTAAALASLSSGIQGAIEVSLGVDASVGSLLTKGEIGQITGKIAQKVITTNVLGTIAARAAVREAGTILEETVEEGAQELVGKLTDFAAAEVMEKKGVRINRESFSKALSDAAESAKMGALAAPVFGLFTGPFQAKVDYKALQGMKEFAKATDRETFKREAAANPAVQNIIDAIPEDQRDETLGKVWENAQAEVRKGEVETKKKAGPVNYVNGSLYTAEQTVTERPDGAIDAILKTGDPKTGDRYGYLRYEIQPTPAGDRQILLKEAHAKAGYENLGGELLLELAAKHPGLEIVTSDGSTERARLLVEKLAPGNPRGAEFGAQYFEGEGTSPAAIAKAKMRTAIVEAMPRMSSAQVEIGMALHEARANALGLGMDTYLEKHFQPGLFSRDTATLQGEFAAARMAGEAEGEGAKAGIAFDKEGKALLYVTEHSNFKSFVHESGHAFRRQTEGTELGQKINALYGISGGLWKREQEEQFTEDLLTWASYGEVRDEGLRGVFEQIGRWLVRLWDAVKGRTKVSPEIEAVMNELLSSEKSPLAALLDQGEAEEAQAVPADVEAQEDDYRSRLEAIADGLEKGKTDWTPQELQDQANYGKEIEEILNKRAEEQDFEEPELTTTTSFDREKVPTVEIPLSEISLSADVPNFKEGAGAAGTVEPLRASRYERLGTAPIVVWERTDGRKEVITGRHRLDLARRTGETSIPGQIVREAEGFTRAQAATFDAEANIRDGQGTVRDYANYFRNSEITEAEASSRGLLSRDKGRAGFAIGRYASEGLYSLFRAGEIGEKKAAAIAEASQGDERLQAAGIKRARAMTAEELFSFVALLRETVSWSDATQADLFGSDDSLLIEAEKLAKEATKVLETLKNEETALKGALRLGKADRAEILAKYGVKAGDEAAIQARLEELAAEIQGWEGWTTDPGRMRELRQKAGLAPAKQEATQESVPEDTRERDAFVESRVNDLESVIRDAEKDVILYFTVQRSSNDGSSIWEAYGLDEKLLATGDSVAGRGSIGNKLYNRKGKYQPVETVFYRIGKEEAFTLNWYFGKVRESAQRTYENIKKEANGDAPILFERYDLFEQQALAEAAVAAFGLTTNPAEAGYVLHDGRMLDFSGKNQLGKGTTAEVSGGTRRLNHESIAQVEGVSKKNPAIDFMRRSGAVRVDFELGAAYSIGVPTFDAAATVAAHARGQFTLHIDGEDGELVGRKTLPQASAEEIARFYDSPTKPETAGLFSEEELGPRVLKGQGLLFEGEERRNSELRDRLYAEMTEEERRQAVLVSEIAGIPNRRAYFEDITREGAKPIQVSIDADSLKWINDNLGHQAGDTLLKKIGEALTLAGEHYGVKGYHFHGDEFAIQGENEAAVLAALNNIDDYLGRVRLEGAIPDAPDYTVVVEGLRISSAIDGEGSYEAADGRLEAEKRRRVQTGERAGRGELPPQVRILQGPERAPLDRDGARAALEHIEQLRAQARLQEAGARGDRFDPESVARRRGEVGGKILFEREAEEVGSLIAVHNLDARKLAFADRLGGFAMPSLAIINKDIPFDSFGDITLLAPKRRIDPRSNPAAQVFNADIYSPRYPSLTYKIDQKKLRPIAQKMAEALTPIYKGSADPYYHDRAPKDYGIADELVDAFNNRGLDNLEFKDNVLAYFRSAIEGKEVDISNLWENRPEGAELERFRKWAENTFEPLLDTPQIFKGFNNAGNRRYAPYTLESVLAEMKKAGLRGGESFNYGLPSIRATVAKQYKTLEEMSRDKDKIVSDPEFEKIKEETGKLFDEILDDAIEVSDLGGFDTAQAFVNNLIEGIKRRNIRKEMETYNFSRLSDATYEKINLLLTTLRDMPTEYFEAKLKGTMSLEGFSGAVVPSTTDERTREILKKHGIEVAEYERGNKESRAKVIGELAEKLGAADFLFETIEEAATTVQDELYARGLEYSVQFSRSSLSRYYAFDLGDRRYRIRVSDHPAPPQSGRWTHSDFAINAKKPEDVEEFRRWIAELAGEKRFGGAMLFEGRDPRDSEAFRAWFGDSKVVDEEGKPKPVYHGTSAIFAAFDIRKAKDKEGRAREMGWGAGKFYFTEVPESASIAAEYAEIQGKGPAPNVIPVYLRIETPISALEYERRLEEEKGEIASRDEAIFSLDEKLKAEGFDGIVDHDSGGMAAFSPAQIKSVFNRGTWDASDPRLLFEEEDIPPIEVPEDPFAANRGRFAAMMERPNELESFLLALWERIKADYDPAKQEEGKPAKSEVEKRLASHPFVLGAAITVGRNGEVLKPFVRRTLIQTIRKNELAFKELFAETMHDPDMAQEVRAERQAIAGPADIKNPRLRGWRDMSLGERTAVLNRIRDAKVRERIESGEITDAEIQEYIGRLEGDRAKLAEKSKQLEANRDRNTALYDALKSAREEARLNARLAVAEVRALYRIRDMRAKLLASILEPPAKRMTYEYKTKIRLIQDYLKAKRWEMEKTEAGGYRKTGRIIEPAALAAGMAQVLRESPGLAKILTANLVSKINDLPLSSWSNEDLETLLAAIESLRETGRREFALKEILRLKANKETRKTITAAARKLRGYKAPLATGSQEEKDQLRALDSKHLGSFSTINMDRFARYFMDRGDPEKKNWALLVGEEREHFRSKMSEVERRVNTVRRYMKENDLKPEKLYRKIVVQGAGPADAAATFSASDLMMANLAMRNPDSRKAFVYGNLFSEEERKGNELAVLKIMAAPRARAVLLAAQKELTQSEKGLMEVIAADFNREFDRLNAAVIALTEEEIAKVDSYVPIRRIGEFFENFSDEIVQDLFARQGIAPKAGPKKGMTKSRIKIGPNNQTPMRLDLWGSFLDAVDKQEHLIEYGEYHKRLVAVYASRQAGEIREAVKHAFGKHGLDYLDRYLAEVANPIQYKDRDYSEKLVRRLRGNLAVGYLAFRWASIANQLITSPLPFVAYAPGRLFTSAAQVLGGPKGFIEEVEGKSLVLRHRQIDPIYEQVRHLDRDGWEGVVKKIGEVGMKGLSWADRWTVAIGWKAVYDQAIAKNPDEDAAIREADNVTLKCQPSARGVDLSPLFRDNNEWKRLVTQFGMQLNIVWQQMRFDVPEALGEKRFGEAIGILVGMSLAGLGLGALRKLRGKDEDDDDKPWNDWLFYAVSQSFDSVPVVGSMISGTAKRLIAGDKSFYRDNDTFPVVGGILGGVEGLAKGRASGIKDLAEAIGLSAGLPTLAVEDFLGWMIDQLDEEMK